MVGNIAAVAEQAIDETIRFYVPGDPDSFNRWNAELERVEDFLVSVEPSPDQRGLLASVRARRIDMAYDVDKLDLVLLWSAQFLQEVPATHSSFFVTVLLRLRALHRTGAHEEEVQTCLEVVRRPEVRGSEYVYLLEHLSHLHPGNISADKALAAKMQEAIDALSAQGYSLPENSHDGDLEQIAIRIANDLRKANRARGESLLAGDI